jgi:hypothetical protein
VIAILNVWLAYLDFILTKMENVLHVNKGAKLVLLILVA